MRLHDSIGYARIADTRTTRALQIALLLVSAVLFAFSLAQPVWKCASGGVQLDGLSVLAIGFMGLLFFDPAWFCNGIFGVAAVSLFLRRRLGPTWLPYVAGGVASTALIGPYLCAATGGPVGVGTGLDNGAKLWIVSVWLASISVLVAPKERLEEFKPTEPSTTS